jgi:hypothetical protein
MTDHSTKADGQPDQAAPTSERLRADRKAYRVEDLPDDLAAMLDGGLAELWNTETVAEGGDIVIG